MSYRYYAQKRRPIALWMLDDASPFQEHGGLGYAAAIKSGSGAPTKHAALVAGAEYASVFSAAAVGEFTCPVYQQGSERKTFALETWMYPVQGASTIGGTQNATNKVKNPSLEVDLAGWAILGSTPNTSITRTTAWSKYGVGAISIAKITSNVGFAGAVAHGPDASNTRIVAPGQFVKSTFTVKNPSATARGVYVSHFFYTAALGLISNPISTEYALASSAEITVQDTSVAAPANAAYHHMAIIISNPAAAALPIGATVYVDGLIVTIHNSSGDPYPTYFDGTFPGAVWNGTAHNSSSTMTLGGSGQEEQAILSHAGQYDGLTIDGNVIKFSTKYLSAGECAVEYDLQFPRACHAVGVHTTAANLLYINNVLVGTTLLTDAQKTDSYIATNGKLYSGETTGADQIALNGVAVYTDLSPEQIAQNFDAGRRVVPQAEVYPQFGGMPFNLAADNGAKFFERTWKVKSDFKEGYIQTVALSDTEISPEYVAGLSVAGSWTIAIPLDAYGASTIYGVMVEWSGKDVTIEGSLDGTSWSALTNGSLVPMIANGMNPTGVDLQVRASFAGGVAEDDAYLESLTIVGFLNNTFDNSQTRTVTVTHPAVLRGDFEPIHMREDNGVRLHGGTLTIGPDTSADPGIARTLEVWVKPVSGAVTFSVSGTRYRNGLTDSTLPVGEWSLVHIVAGANVTTDITIAGNCIVGQVNIYPTALSADNVLFLYRSYVGKPYISVNDTALIIITEPATPAELYAHDWSITGGGG